MKVDALLNCALQQVPESVRVIQNEGYNGVCTTELSHDPFLPLLLAAEHSEQLELATSIAVGFARSPMNLAYLGHDLNAYSKGRLTIGLGSQIKPHITKRFSMPWGAPAAKMRELVMAMRAIWDSWYLDKPLSFVGEFYTHTLMPPAFTPKNIEYGPPRLAIAAVGPRMCEVAGEVGDGMILHPFSTLPYIDQVVLPAIEAGLAKAGKARRQFEISYGCMVVTGSSEEEFLQSKRVMRDRIAFYGSTPAYQEVLESIGAGELQPELNSLSKQGRWQEMGDLIDDDLLQAFAVVGEPAQIGAEILRRYGSRVDRILLDTNLSDAEQRRNILTHVQATDG